MAGELYSISSESRNAAEQMRRNDCVKCCAKVYEQHPDIGVLSV